MRNYLKHRILKDYDNNDCYVCGKQIIDDNKLYIMEPWHQPRPFNTDICKACEKVVALAKNQIIYSRNQK